MLRKVRIQNFKSLKDVTLELQKVNLLIGPNNSGKSNFLKGLEKFKLLVSDYSDNYLLNLEEKKEDLFQSKFSNIKSIIKYSDFYKKENKTKISFEVTLENESDNLNKYAEIEITNGLTFHINTIPDTNVSTLSGPRWLKHNFGSESNENLLEEEKYSDDVYEVDFIFNQSFKDLTIYKPDPNSLTKPFPILPNQSLINSDASNIVAFFDTLRDEYPDNFRAIEVDIQKCIPELSGLRFENIAVQPDDNLYKIYGDKTYKRLGLFDNVKKITYWADELSEGTLYFLALLCIIHQPNPPKLLLLEEPEKGIHPRRIHEIMKFIFQLVEDKDIQVIMTSHNEHVLEEFTTMPESVFIFDKDDEGATFVKNLQKDIIEPGIIKAKEFGIEPIDYTDNIGENWFMGLMGGVPA